VWCGQRLAAAEIRPIQVREHADPVTRFVIWIASVGIPAHYGVSVLLQRA
jgi:hypothetical protein